MYQCKGKKYNEISVGEEIYSTSRTLTEADIVNFAGLSGDFNPLHTNEEYAKNTPHKGRISHGALTFAISTGLINQTGFFDGTTIGILGVSLKFTSVVKPGDTIYTVIKITDKRETSKSNRGIVTFSAKVYNQNDIVVLDQEYKMMIQR